MGRDLRSLHKLIDEKGVESVDKANAYLQQITSIDDIPLRAPESPMEEAQELVYQALEAEDKKERVRLAMKAIETCQDCTDAYVLLAREAAEAPEQARDWYQVEPMMGSQEREELE